MASTTIIVRTLNSHIPSPGPGSYDIPSDFGKAPSWTIKHKYKKKAPEKGPGYQNLGTTIGQGRKSAITNKIQDRDYTQSPGPSYMPPSLGSDAQKSSFHERINRTKKDTTPGPGSYNIATQFDGKKYSIKSRTWIREEGEIPGPGVGSLNPDYRKIMKSSTACSIRPKLSDPKTEPTPSPNDYTINRDLSKISSTFHQKRIDFGPEKTPGPLVAPHVFGSDGPKHTIRGRIDLKSDKPDPEIRTLKGSFGNTRPVSMHQKRYDRDWTQSPGPSYVPPPFGSEGRKSSMGSRRNTRRRVEQEPPGPGKYDPRPQSASHAYTIASKAEMPREGPPNTPGPDAFRPDYNVIMKSSIKTVILERHPEKDPGPGAPYQDLGSTLTRPKITIGLKDPVPVHETDL